MESCSFAILAFRARVGRSSSISTDGRYFVRKLLRSCSWVVHVILGPEGFISRCHPQYNDCHRSTEASVLQAAQRQKETNHFLLAQHYGKLFPSSGRGDALNTTSLVPNTGVVIASNRRSSSGSIRRSLRDLLPRSFLCFWLRRMRVMVKLSC